MLKIIQDFLIDEESISESGELEYLTASAQIQWHGKPVSTIAEDKAADKLFGVCVYHYGDGDIQIGDEQTQYYFGNDRSKRMTFEQLPATIQEWVIAQVDLYLQNYL